MRKGTNTKKDVLLELPNHQHRVIIPLYIPHENDYYKEAFQIFEMCLHSLRKTASSALVISVVCNACDANVVKKTSALYETGAIDELVVVRDTIGKLNAILKVLRTSQERLITITDADVLFLNNWEAEVLKVFQSFPKAGVVSPVPLFGNMKKLTFNIWFDYFFSEKLRFKKVKDPEGMTRFVNSIGWPRLDKRFKDVILTLNSTDGCTAVVGCNHMTATYKREVFESMPKGNSAYQLGGNSEYDYLDVPVVKHDGYRLATHGNYAYHMGNTLEDWMVDTCEGLKDVEKSTPATKQLRILKRRKSAFFLKQKLMGKIFRNVGVQKWFYRKKGLEKAKLEYFFPKK
tara:strand:+ start:90949 stop:91983 length:1035 start_codon:yes stop_codon:yes gene_type:complete